MKGQFLAENQLNSERKMMATILLLNGPNLNLLGTREPETYGKKTLEELESDLIEKAKIKGHNLYCFQSNHEGQLIDRIHQGKNENIDFMIINAGAYTHTSIALRDALLGIAIPFIEVHISNIYGREPFRHHSYIADLSKGTLSGFGILGYHLALDAIDCYLLSTTTKP